MDLLARYWPSQFGAMEMGAVGLAFLLMFLLRRMSSQRQSARASVRALLLKNAEQQRALDLVMERAMEAEQSVAALAKTLRELPEIAQRLTSAGDLREIPGLALDLVQEMFLPTYSVFFKAVRGQLVAADVRGSTEFKMGQQIEMGEGKVGAGVVGWTATRQLVVTPADVELEPPVARSIHRLGALGEFLVCLPLIRDELTIGVILIGPTQRGLPYELEMARTLALITSVSITTARLLLEQTMLAQRDGLTGLLNKVHILGKLEQLLNVAEPIRKPVSVFLFDIDHFKNYNDTNGHLPGDKLLKTLGKLLTDSVREGEFVGRYGGEEFLMILPGATKEEALVAADRIRSLIAEYLFPFRESQPGGHVSISGGVATYPNDSLEAEALVNKADEALYEAKGAGRNRVGAYGGPELALEGEPLLFDR